MQLQYLAIRVPCRNDISYIFGIYDLPPPPVRIYSILRSISGYRQKMDENIELL